MTKEPFSWVAVGAEAQDCSGSFLVAVNMDCIDVFGSTIVTLGWSEGVGECGALREGGSGETGVLET